jgi:pimeloyl-ACP methyl ester carboxylesterase
MSPTLELRMLFNTMAESTQKKGLTSCINYLDSFNFEKLYSHSSINQQLSFNKIPILLINGSRDPITPPLYVNKFRSIMTSELTSLKDKNTIISPENALDNLTIVTLKAGHNPMFGSFANFVHQSKDFLELKS